MRPEGDPAEAADAGQDDVEATKGGFRGDNGAPDVTVLEPPMAPPIISMLARAGANARVSSGVSSTSIVSHAVVPGWSTRSRADEPRRRSHG